MSCTGIQKVAVHVPSVDPMIKEGPVDDFQRIRVLLVLFEEHFDTVLQSLRNHAEIMLRSMWGNFGNKSGLFDQWE